MKVDPFGQSVYTSDDIFNLLYENPDLKIDGFFISDPSLYNCAVKELHLDYPHIKEYKPKTINIKDFDKQNQENWFIPDEYKNLNIKEYLIKLCKNKEQLDRVDKELILYDQFNLNNLLRFLIYLVDTMRQNDIVWGVGRGSSVASYILFLIGLHKIDSIKYDLDITEFLR